MPVDVPSVGCAVSLLIIRHHHRHFQLFQSLAWQSNANVAARMFDHPSHLFRAAMIRCDDKITFVLSVLVVHDDQKFASRERCERIIHRVKRENIARADTAVDRIRRIGDAIERRRLRHLLRA